MKLRLTLLTAVLLGTMLLTSSLETTGEEPPLHPFIKPADIKSETCLTCHPEKEEGKFVHSAVASGCESCHQATSENETTNITLLATGGELCAMCHQVKETPVIHGPYKSGQCLVCHEAHTSNFPGVVRAEPNTLCMSCHGVDQPDVKIDKESQSVTLLGGRKITLEEYRKATKIGLDGSGTKGHPVTGKDRLNPEAALSCLSCHAPHGSEAAKLLRRATESRQAAENLCLDCHTEIRGQVQKPIQHAAVDMGCLTCHTTHTREAATSPQNVFHLTQAQPDLCLTCHDVSAEDVQKAHLG